MVLLILNDTTMFWHGFEGSGFPETLKIDTILNLEILCFCSNENKRPGPVFLGFGVHFGVSFGAPAC